MGAIAIITLVVAVPPALFASVSLVEKAIGRRGNTNVATPERTAAQYAYDLTYAYALKAFLMISLLSFNYQNANPMIRTGTPVVGTEANNVVSIENSDAASDDVIGGGLPRPVQDPHH